MNTVKVMSEEKPILDSIQVHYKNAASITITAYEIKKINDAVEGLDLINSAKIIAQRLSKL